MAKTCLKNGECIGAYKCECNDWKRRNMNKKDEEVRVVNRLYDQATKQGKGEEWHARFLHYIKRKGMSIFDAAHEASKEQEVTKVYL